MKKGLSKLRSDTKHQISKQHLQERFVMEHEENEQVNSDQLEHAHNRINSFGSKSRSLQDGISDSLIEVELIPEPTEEPDLVLADRRRPPTIRDEVVTVFLNSILPIIVESWEGTHSMRPILKAQSTQLLGDKFASVQDNMDTVPDTIHSVYHLRGHKLTSDSRRKKLKDKESLGSMVTLKGKKKVKRGKDSLEKSVPNEYETDSNLIKEKYGSTDKINRKSVKEKELKEDQNKASIAGEHDSRLGRAEKKEETKKLSLVGPGSKIWSPDADSTENVVQIDETQILSTDSWRIHLPDEEAQVVMKQGNHYEGRISRKLMEGRGIFTWADGSQYNGEFVGGEMTGTGRLLWPDLSWYEGDVVRGWRHGRGLYVSSHKKLVYHGGWVAGRKHGSGIIFYSEEETDYYDGEWVNDTREGYGLRVYPSGARYLGNWHDEMREGVGIMLFANGDVYEGYWKEGLMNGYGVYTWETFGNSSLVFPAKNMYSGQFENGLRHGDGSFDLLDGQQVQGEWWMDKKDGKAIMICGNGSVFWGNPMFRDDRPITLTNEFESDDKIVSTRKPEVDRNVAQADVARTKIEQKFGVKPMSLLKPLPEHLQIKRGQYFPIHTPFQNIDLSHYIVRLTQLRHPIASTSCQTDNIELPTSESSKVAVFDSAQSERKSKSVTELTHYDRSVQTELTLVTTRTSNTSSHSKDLTKLSMDVNPSKPQQDKSSKIKSSTRSVTIENNKVILKSPNENSIQVSKTEKTVIAQKSVLPTAIQATKTQNKQKELCNKYPRNRAFNRRKHGQRFKTPDNIVFQKNRPTMQYPGDTNEIVYEEKFLRNTLTYHLPLIRKIYEDYARVDSNIESMSFKPVMLRIMLWQFYRDCGINRKVSLVELDQMMAENPLSLIKCVHWPFEKIQLWQFLYSLIDAAWILYASKDLDKPNSRGVLGSAFEKLMNDDVIPRPEGHIGSVLFEHRNLFYFDPVYMLYKSLGEPLSVHTYLRKMCTRSGALDKPPPPYPIALYPDYIVDGVNTFVFGGFTSFVPKKTPISCDQQVRYCDTRQDPHATALTTCRNLRADVVTKILTEVCPRVKTDGLIVNVDYQMTFLEFYEVLIKCASWSMDVEERRKERLAAAEKRRMEIEEERSAKTEDGRSLSHTSDKPFRVKQKKSIKPKS